MNDKVWRGGDVDAGTTPLPESGAQADSGMGIVKTLEEMLSGPGTAEQPKPISNDSTPIWDLVRADIDERDKVGRARYGTPLQAFNGRDALVDAYQESLDKVVYLRKEIEERRLRGEILDEAIRAPALDSGCVRIHVNDLNALLEERRRLNLQVGDLQWGNNRLVEERRTTINARVREFYAIADQRIPEKIGVPDDKTVRFRVRLVLEETLELLKATIADSWEGGSQRHPYTPVARSPHKTLTWLHDALMDLLLDAEVEVNLPEWADACADIDYVVEGARIAFGIDGEPILQRVHAANLKKLGGPIRESDGKRLKPEGWLPPDIEGALVAQGWRR